MGEKATTRRPLALGAAATIGFGSLFFATPAFAEEEAPTTDQTQAPVEGEAATEGQSPADDGAPAEESNVSEEAPSEDDKKPVEEAGVEIVAYGVNAAGETVVVTTEDSAEGEEAEAAIETFVQSQGLEVTAEEVHEVELPNAPVAYAEEGDVVAGAGYASLANGSAYACSIGFTAWTMGDSGRVPALIGAGHCGYDENDSALSDTTLTIPSEEPAVGGEGYGFPENPILLGNFSFAQFGGPGVGNPGANGDENSTDIAVIDVNTQGGWNILPEVTNWTTAGDELHSLADGTVAVKNAGAVQAGVNISKSGRTTGFTTSTVAPGETDPTTGEHITDGWSMIEDRWVRGFSATLEAGPGDSGGSVIQGETAVGVISGGDEATQWTWSTSLVHGLAQVDGDYEVALDIDAPEVTSHPNGAELEPGEEIVGSAPSNATNVGISFAPNSGESVEVVDGTWTTSAPSTPGEYTMTYSASNGLSSSESQEFTFEVVEGAVAAPVVTSPADGSTVEPPVETIEGTGIAGAILTMEGDVNSTVDVDEDGNWSVPTNLEEGEYTISVFQTVEGEDSRTIYSSFTVAADGEEPPGDDLAAPAITSLSDGDTFSADAAPSAVSGTGEAGASLGLRLNGDEDNILVAEVAADGSWTVDLGGQLQPGAYEIAAAQNLDGETSDWTIVNITVNEGATPPPGDDGNEDELPETGGPSVLPMALAAGILLLVGGAVTVLAARRQRGTEA